MKKKIEVDAIMLLKCMHGYHYCPHCSQRVSTDCNLPIKCGSCGYPLHSEKISSRSSAG